MPGDKSAADRVEAQKPKKIASVFSSPASQRWIHWGGVPLLLGGILLANFLGQGLLNGARDAVIHTSALLGSGDLTVQPQAELKGGSAFPVIVETGAVFSNPALMRVPGQVAARVEVRVESAAGGRTQAVDLLGLEAPKDPQAVLLMHSLVEGAWPAAEPPGEAGAHEVVLGAALSERLGLKVGDSVQVKAGVGRGQRAWTGRVKGILRTGLVELDGGRMWTGLSSAQELLPVPESMRAEATTRIAVYFDRPTDVAEWLAAVRRLTLPEGTEVLTWRQVSPDALPWNVWQRAQFRADQVGFTALALAGAASGFLCVWALGGRLGTSLAWTLPSPLLIGLTFAIGGYALLWMVGRTAPLPAGLVFGTIGPDLNPFGGLATGVALNLGVSRALQLCLVAVATYGMGALISLVYAQQSAAKGATSPKR